MNNTDTNKNTQSPGSNPCHYTIRAEMFGASLLHILPGSGPGPLHITDYNNIYCFMSHSHYILFRLQLHQRKQWLSTHTGPVVLTWQTVLGYKAT
jgi:hypothetical protein